MGPDSESKRGAYVLDAGASLFQELWAMHVAWISMAATVALHGQHASATRVIANLVTGALEVGKRIGRGEEAGSRLEFHGEIWQFPDRLRAPGPGLMLVVRGARDLFLKISLPAQSPPTRLAFDVLSVEEAEAEENYEVPDSHSHEFPERYLATIWGYIIAAAYERYQPEIFATYGGVALITTWPPELQFLFHVRNACSHHGTFDIWAKKNRIDPKQPPRWRDVVIPSEAAVAGLYALGGLLSLCDALLFVHDISRLLDGLPRQPS